MTERQGGKPIYVCFATDDRLKSWFIRKVTRSELTHSYIEYSSAQWGGRWVVHSTGRGVITETKENLEKRYPYRRIYRFDPSVADPEHNALRSGLDAVRDYVGTADYDRYVFWDAFLLTIHNQTRWDWLTRLRPKREGMFTCTAFLALILKEAGFSQLADVSPYSVTAADLMKIVESEGELFTLVEDTTRA